MLPVASATHVVCAADDAFAIPLCVTLTSLVVHFDPERQLILHVLSRTLNETARENLKRSLEINRTGLRNLEIRYHLLSEDLFANLAARRRFSIDTFSRLFAASLVGPDCERFLYLDSDMIVRADVSRLVDEAVAPVTVHAARDIGAPFAACPTAITNFAERGLAPDTRMFNAGLLVIDRQRWLDGDITEKALQLAIDNGNRGGDQMALNTLLHDDWAELDPRWNQCHDMLFHDRARRAGLSRSRWRECRASPFVIHYTGQPKPWSDPRWKPRYSEFFKYLDRTVYSGSIRRRWHLDDLLGPAIYFRLWLGLRLLYRFSCKVRGFIATPHFDSTETAPLSS